MPTISRLLLLSVALLGIVLAACGGGSKDAGFSSVIQVGGNDKVTPVIANSELVAGPNRFVLGLLGPDGTPIVDAKVHLKFYFLSGDTAVLKSEMDAVSRVPARDAGVSEEEVQILPDGTKHVQINATDDVGVYTAQVTFDAAGDWGVEATVNAAKPKVQATVRPRFNVLAKGATPAIGSPAPRSRNLTLKDVSDITQIDSSANPSPDMHTTTIADAIAAAKPALVLFAVPGYCESRFCGPELEIMRKVAPKYAGKVTFIHVEFYNNPSSPQRTPVDTVNQWNLRTEPWFFVIDANGNIAAKFEGPTGMDELDGALQQVIGQ
jgi:hypothetical protein